MPKNKSQDTAIKFTFLTGDVNWQDYGGSWVSQKICKDNIEFYLVKEFINQLEDCGSDAPTKYRCILSMVSPQQFQKFDEAFESAGWDIPKEDLTEENKVEIIHGYSGGVQLWEDTGNNYKLLIQKCNEEASMFSFLLRANMVATEPPAALVAGAGKDVQIRCWSGSAGVVDSTTPRGLEILNQQFNAIGDTNWDRLKGMSVLDQYR